jgi:hypothetical protein
VPLIRKPSIKLIILIADLAVVVAGLVCVVLTAVIPRFGETDLAPMGAGQAACRTGLAGLSLWLCSGRGAHR